MRQQIKFNLINGENDLCNVAGYTSIRILPSYTKIGRNVIEFLLVGYFRSSMCTSLIQKNYIFS